MKEPARSSVYWSSYFLPNFPMKRFASAAMALAIGLAPAAPAFADDGTHMDTMTDSSSDSTSSAHFSLDLLSMTDFALNPTDDTWISVVQQIRAHPCYQTVGEEQDMCEDEFGLKTDLKTMLSGTNFSAWLRDLMIDSLCGGQAGVNRSSCLMGIPSLSATDSLRFQNQLNGNGSIDVSNNDEDDNDDVTDLSESNEELFERAGTAPTTRQNALDIIEENEDNETTDTPYERSVKLWDWCESSGMGQGGCFHSFQRFVEDDGVSEDEIRDAIMGNE
jgi:hypothetical protein